MQSTNKEGKYSYYEVGEGTPIIILHGLMGGLSNCDGVAQWRGDTKPYPHLGQHSLHWLAHVQSTWQRPNHAAGSWQPGKLPEYLDQGDVVAKTSPRYAAQAK